MTYYKTKEFVEEYISLAKGYDGKKLIEELKNNLIKDSKLLELGSGPGVDWEILSETYKVTGSDNSINFLNHLIANNKNGTFLKLDATSINTNLKFDGKYSNKVLHNLTDSDLKSSIIRQAEILNSKGIVCHSFWKGKSSEVFKGLIVNYHNDEELRDLFNTHFDIISIELYKEFEEGDSLLLIARRKN